MKKLLIILLLVPFIVKSQTFYKEGTGQLIYKNRILLSPISNVVNPPTSGGDTEPPVVSLIGGSNINITQGETYTDSGFTANDNVDGDITLNVVIGGDIVDTNTIGVYVITYTATDVASNSATVNRTVNVISTTQSPPPINDNVGVCTPDSNPVSVTTLAQLTASPVGSTVRIDGTINATNTTLPANLVIVSGSGLLSGTNVNLNNACILNDFTRVFGTSITFSEVYTNSRLSPETFGAISNTTSDDSEIVTLINNCQYAIGNTNSVYVKNEESTFVRSGLFDWNMNGAIIRTLSAANLSHGTAQSNLNKYLFRFETMTVNFSNGTLDGQDLASRSMRMQRNIGFNFTDMTFRNYYAPPNAFARGVALKLNMYGSTFTGGTITNCTFEDIGAQSDNNANNTPFGVSKAIYVEIFDQGATPATLVMDGNDYDHIYGDDAEAFYNAPGFGGVYNYATNNISFEIRNETVVASERRAYKVNASNTIMENLQITSSSDQPIFAGSQAGLVQIFPIRNEQTIRNVSLTNSTISCVGNSQNVTLGINDATETTIENNVFTASNVAVQRSVQFGVFSTQGGLYEGDISNTVIFRNNTLVNNFVLFNNLYVPVNGGLVFEDNTFDITLDRNIGGGWGAFRIAAQSGETAPLVLKDITINVNQTFNAGTLFSGVIHSLGRSLKNVTFDNVDLNYTGTATLPAFTWGNIGSSQTANFDNTNTILNCDMTGDIGTGSINVSGSGSPVITNSFGDGNTPITVQ